MGCGSDFHIQKVEKGPRYSKGDGQDRGCSQSQMSSKFKEYSGKEPPALSFVLFFFFIFIIFYLMFFHFVYFSQLVFFTANNCFDALCLLLQFLLDEM